MPQKEFHVSPYMSLHGQANKELARVLKYKLDEIAKAEEEDVFRERMKLRKQVDEAQKKALDERQRREN